MKQRIIRIVTLCIKDLKDAVRDARVMVALILPLGFGVFYSFALDDSSVNTIHADVALAIAGQSQLPTAITQQLPDNVKVRYDPFPNQAAVEKDVGRGNADVGIVIPASFDAQLAAGGQPELIVIRAPSSSLGGDYVMTALDPALRSLAGQTFPARISMVDAEQISRANVSDRLGIRTWSLMIAIVMMLALVSILAIPIVLAEEVEKKTIDALVLAMPYGEVIIAKALLGMVYVAVMTTLLLAITRLQVTDWPLFIAATGLTGLALLGLGLLLGGIFKSANQLNTWSGLFLTPILAPAIVVGQPVPDLFNTIAGLFPTGAGTKLLINSVANEPLFANQVSAFLVLLVWGIVSYLLLLWQLKRRQG